MPGSLGAALRAARLAHGLEFVTVEEETKIRSGYLEALEEGRFQELPPTIYVRRLLKCLAFYYGLDEHAAQVEFAAERAVFVARESEFARLHLGREASARRFGRPIAGGSFFNAHHMAAIGVAVVAVLGLSGYVVHQVQSFSAAPTLELAEPRSDIIVAHRTIFVRGTAEAGSKVTINNQEVLTNEGGSFEVPYELSRGQNVITVVAEKKNGKSTRLSHTVSADYPEPTLPEAPAEGFLATVTASSKTWVRVSLDGETTFEGLLESAEKKTFHGKDELQLRTGNAGATRVAINGRDQGAVGRDGQAGSYVYTDPRTVGLVTE